MGRFHRSRRQTAKPDPVFQSPVPVGGVLVAARSSSSTWTTQTPTPSDRSRKHYPVSVVQSKTNKTRPDPHRNGRHCRPSTGLSYICKSQTRISTLKAAAWIFTNSHLLVIVLQWTGSNRKIQHEAGAKRVCAMRQTGKRSIHLG